MQLILRTLTSPYNDITKGSVLSQQELDENLINLKGELIYTATSVNNTITLQKINGDIIEIPFSGGSIDQNNIFRVKRGNYIIDTSLVTRAYMANHVNNLPSFTITDKDIFIFQLTNTNLDPSTPITYRFVLKNVGKGTYGNGGTQITQGNIEILSLGPDSYGDIIDDATTQIFNFGEIGSTTISNYVNSLNPSVTFQNQVNGYVVINTLVSGNTSDYLFIGSGGTYGLNAGQTTDVDFQVLSTNYPGSIPIPDVWVSGSTGTKSIKANNSTGLDATGNYAVASGYQTIASGTNSHAEGGGTIASGNFGSHAEGNNTIASGTSAHAEGQTTKAFGNYSHAEGQDTIASNDYSHAEGFTTIASGTSAHAEGVTTIAGGGASHAEGLNTRAIGNYSHAEGQNSIASNTNSHAEGQNTTASGVASHAEGFTTIASGSYSHAEGENTIASGSSAHAEGRYTIAGGQYSHAQGNFCLAMNSYSHASGSGCNAYGIYSFVHGRDSIASGNTTIVLGGDITGTVDGTTYVDRLSIKTYGPYTTHTDADNDNTMPNGGIYRLFADRTAYIKP